MTASLVPAIPEHPTSAVTPVVRIRPWSRVKAGLVTVAAAAALLTSAACSDSDNASTTSGGGSPRPVDSRELSTRGSYGGNYGGGSATGDTHRGAAFARWVLEQDPQRKYITDAVVRQESSLGVKVQPNISKGDLQQLMVSLAEGMARTFPNKPLHVIAFYQSGDRLAQAEYDPRSGQVDVRFV